ncbi:MAG: GntR family transcriptional regulator [Planctomycetota bacterium]
MIDFDEKRRNFRRKDFSQRNGRKQHKNGSGIDVGFPLAQRTTLRESVYTEIYNRLIGGALPTKTRLNEVQIANQMGISRGPVREAIRQLEQDGLLTSSPGKGTFVRGLSPDDLSDCYVVRMALESLAVGLLMKRAKPKDLEELDQYIRNMREHQPSDGEMSKLTVKFHAKICELSANKTLLKAWQSMADQIRAMALSTLSRVYTDSCYVAMRHQDILDTIRSGNVEIAQKTIQEHISESAAKIVGYFRISQTP